MSITACTTALKNNPDTRGAAHSLLRIGANLLQTFLARDKFFTTACQSSYAAKINRPSYLKLVTARAFSAYGRPLEMVTSFK